MFCILRTIENGSAVTVLPYSPRKTRSNGPRFELVGATAPEVQAYSLTFAGGEPQTTSRDMWQLLPDNI